jgi:hypothetical protein
MKLTDKYFVRTSGDLNRLYDANMPGHPNVVVLHPRPVDPGRRPKGPLLIGLAILANPHLRSKAAEMLGLRCWHLIETRRGWDLALVTKKEGLRNTIPPDFGWPECNKGIPIPWSNTYETLEVAQSMLKFAVRNVGGDTYEAHAA